MAKRVSLYGILVALAFIASYIEVLIPFNFHVPGMKLGLANIVVLIALYTGGARAGITVSVIRIILVGFTFGNPYSAIYGLSGGILSFVIMFFLKKTDFFGIAGVSIIKTSGSIFLSFLSYVYRNYYRSVDRNYCGGNIEESGKSQDNIIIKKSMFQDIIKK